MNLRCFIQSEMIFGQAKIRVYVIFKIGTIIKKENEGFLKLDFMENFLIFHFIGNF